MRNASEKQLLKGVSRSFYLTLRLLPGPMRGPASLAYLLARTSDTLADTAAVPTALRMDCLDQFGHAIAGLAEPPRWPALMENALTDPQERRLLDKSAGLIMWLESLPAGEAELVREVTGIIIGGQQLDLQRFALADRQNPLALTDDAALEDYAWRVAGCVGAFWTKLGFLTLGERFSSAPVNVLLEQAAAYGKGLQLVNILRDLAADLATGRCYLPVANPHDTAFLLDMHGRWVDRAWDWVGAGIDYADTLYSRRLRAATVLPAMIARETLERMRRAGGAVLQTRVKVPRTRVYLALARAFL
ncbi:MAG: squalene/phytoene synthase family protein [Verrucomicrobia bacterium]|nr:squalene/phytoene synthase family protein [Verrucomicrobiota bacterium]